jgi:hypothetical protein
VSHDPLLFIHWLTNMAGEKVDMFTADPTDEDDPSVAAVDEEAARPVSGSIPARHVHKL